MQENETLDKSQNEHKSGPLVCTLSRYDPKVNNFPPTLSISESGICWKQICFFFFEQSTAEKGYIMPH